MLFALSRLLSDGSKTDTVSLKVPAGCCVNKPEPQARAALEGAGFNVTEELQKNDLMPTGNVISRRPGRGHEHRRHQGPEGQRQADRQQRRQHREDAQRRRLAARSGHQHLEGATGFSNISSQQAPSDDPNVQVGEVTQQNPASGSDVPKSQAVTLTVSSGQDEGERARRAGKSPAEAGGTLGNAGLKVSKTQNEASDTVPSGQVTRTDPRRDAGGQGLGRHRVRVLGPAR